MNRRGPLLALLAALVAAPVAAQTATPATDAHRVSIWIGPSVVSGASDTGPAVSGSVGIELSRWAALEGAGTYFDRGAATDALGLHASLLVNLKPDARRVLPYAAAGVGIYRASFDLDAPSYFGGMGGQFGPGTSFCGGTGDCPYGQMPAFYGRRLGGVMTPASGARFGTRTFTDPAASMGAGARIDVTSHVFVRPDARLLFVFGDGQTETLGTVSIAFGYRF